MSEMENGARPSADDSPVPVAIGKVHRRLQRWRSERKGRERIPEALWAAAGELAREHGVNRVAQALHLEFNQLKRVAEAGPPKGRKRAAPTFVELITPHRSAGRECVIEVAGRRGKLRIELPGTATAELAGISRALWEMIS